MSAVEPEAGSDLGPATRGREKSMLGAQVQRRGRDDVVRLGKAQVAQLMTVNGIDSRVAVGEHRHRL
jgi:hypothetical protein